MVHSNAKKVRAHFFANTNRKQPVRDWLLSLDVQDRRTIGEDIKAVEYGWPRGYHPPSLIKRLDGKINEVRSEIGDRRIARVLFAVIEQEMVLLHGFVKKTRKTPKADLELARNRLRDYIQG